MIVYAYRGATVHQPVEASSIPSLTIASFEDGLKKVITGARGTFNIDSRAGDSLKLNFNFSGAYVEPTDVALLTDVETDGLVPPPFLSAAFTIDDGAYADAIISEYNIDAGAVVSPRTDASAASGILSFDVTDRAPSVQLNPEKTLMANHNVYSKITASTRESIYARAGSTSGNRMELYSCVQYHTPDETEEGGRDLLSQPGMLKAFSDAGDDELFITIY